MRKYDASGNEVWTRQFGTATDQANGVAVDGLGHLRGSATYSTGNGGNDAFVGKYDASGTEVWTRQFGTSQPG